MSCEGRQIVVIVFVVSIAAFFIAAVILSSICGWQCRKHFSAFSAAETSINELNEKCSTDVGSNSLFLRFDGFCTTSQESVVMSCSRAASNNNLVHQSQCTSSLSAPELTLSELHGGCETDAKSRRPECVGAMHRYCNRMTYPSTQDSLGISREHSNLKTHLSCIKAYWKGKVQISELQEFHKGCNVHKSQHRDCLSAIHRLCVDHFGSNFAGMSQEVGESDFIVGCFEVSHKESLRHQVLTDLHGSCKFPNSDSDNCFAAASRYCAQYFGSSGGITQEVNKEVMTVACYEASYSGIAHHIRNTEFFTAKTRGEEVCELKFDLLQGKILACVQDTLFTKTYNNSNSSTELISTLTFEKLIQDESRFEFSGPLVIEPSVTFSTAIPSIFSKEISLNSLRTVHFSTSQIVSHINVKCIEKCEVEVPPFTHIIKEAVVTRAKLQVPWTARVRNGLGAVIDVAGVWFGDDTYNLQITQKINTTSNSVE